ADRPPPRGRPKRRRPRTRGCFRSNGSPPGRGVPRGSSPFERRAGYPRGGTARRDVRDAWAPPSARGRRALENNFATGERVMAAHDLQAALDSAQIASLERCASVSRKTYRRGEAL